MRKIFILSLMVFIMTFTCSSSYAGWLIYHKPAFSGKIIDAETKEPIEGAVVVAIYQKEPIISGPGGGSSSIINIKEILTDKNGEFHISPYLTIIQPLSIEDRVEFIIYKPGYWAYHNFPAHPDEFILFALSEGIGFSRISETLKRRVEDKWRKKFEEMIKNFSDEQKARTSFGVKAENFLPLLPMKGAKERLRSLNIPYYKLPDDADIENIKWINMFEKDIDLREISDYMVIGLPKANTWQERRMQMVSPAGEKRDWKKQKQLIRLLREDWEYIYKKPAGDLYKIEEGY